MKIAFIKVSMIDGISHDAMKPLIFLIIQSLTPEKYNIDFWDDRVELLPDVLDADIIALSVETFAAKRAYYLANKYKTVNNIVVMGGFHPTILPDECAKYCDVVITGDAEDTWKRFLDDFEVNSIKPRYDSSLSEGLLCTSLNASCIKGKKYLPLATVQLSRGCKFSCDFCSVKTMYPRAVRKKSIDDIISELKSIKEKLVFL